MVINGYWWLMVINANIGLINPPHQVGRGGTFWLVSWPPLNNKQLWTIKIWIWLTPIRQALLFWVDQSRSAYLLCVNYLYDACVTSISCEICWCGYGFSLPLWHPCHIMFSARKEFFAPGNSFPTGSYFKKQRNEIYTRMTWDLFCRMQLTQKQYTCPFLRAAYPLASCLPEGELNTALLSDSHSKNGWRFSEWLCWELLEGFCSSHYVTVSTYR